MPPLSFAVTAFNEMSEGRCHGGRIQDCILPPQVHDAIDEIVIVDDASDDFPEMSRLVSGASKVKVFQNETNRGVFGNKLEAVARATGEWVINCDSDNVKTFDHLNFVDSLPLDPRNWYCPSFAMPKFDYRSLVGSWHLKNIHEIIDARVFQCFFNTGNQVVHRGEFVRVFGKYRNKRADLMMPNYLGIPEEERASHKWRLVFDALDSFIFNLEWLRAGNRLVVVEGLEYNHYYASGDEGNYQRSPDEKGKMGQFLYDVLRREMTNANR